MTPSKLRILAIAAAMVCAGCSTSTAGADSQPSKYTQTWSKSYSDTTCTEWTTVMTGEQRFAGAADMLTGARNKGDGGTGLPSDALIEQFEGDVSEGCSVQATADQLSVADAGATVYLIGRDTYRP